MWFIIIPL